MKILPIVAGIICSVNLCQAQMCHKDKVCGADTIHVNYRDLKTGDRNSYDAFLCTQVSPLGMRLNFGFSSFSYYGGTRKWIGNHNAGVFGLSVVYGKFNVGLNFKLTTVTPATKLVFSGDTLTKAAKLNPVKADFYAGYSLDLDKNFSIEPHLGLTRNVFYVINEKELNQSFSIPKIYGLTPGVTLNKYFKSRDFQFFSVFISYHYGFTNFRKINPALGKGYSEWTIGLAYKVFAKRTFHEKLN